MIADETFESTDRNRLQPFPDHALGLALRLLRTHSPADRRQHVRLVDHRQRTIDVLHEQVSDETRDVDRHRTTRYAGWSLALEAPFSLSKRLGQRVAHGDLIERTGSG